MRLKVLVNSTFEEEKALLDLDAKKVVLSGDYYHNKIDEKIEGFLDGLKYCGIGYEMLEKQYITPDMRMFETCEFEEC